MTANLLTPLTENRSRYYELTDETRLALNGATVYRIRATCDLPYHGVKKGDLGGWVQSYCNLTGMAWVADDAMACDDSNVSGVALLRESAYVDGAARIKDEAVISGNTHVTDNALVTDKALIMGNARIGDSAHVGGRVSVSGSASIDENAHVTGSGEIRDNAIICGNAHLERHNIITDHAYIDGNAHLCGYTTVSGDAYITGRTVLMQNNKIGGRTRISYNGILRNIDMQNDEHITNGSHIYSVENIGPERHTVTLYRTRTGHNFIVGDWVGDVYDLIRMVEEQQKTWDEFGDAVAQARWMKEYQDIKEQALGIIDEWSKSTN